MVFILIMGGQNVSMSLVLAMILEIFVFFAGAFSMNSFQYFRDKIICIGGAQELETVQILVRK